MSIPTNADVAEVLDAAEPPNRPKSRPGFTAYVALCAFAGLRRGEALGVQVGDIDFLARTLRVTRQIQRAKSADVEAGKDLVEAVAGITVMTRPPKYESERTIYLPDELVAILSEHVRQHTPTRRARPGGCSTRTASLGTTTSSTTAGGRPAPTPASPSSSTSFGTTSPAA